MGLCRKCFTDVWTLTELPYGMTEAVCNGCGSSFEFETKKRNRDLTEADHCPKCQSSLTWTRRKMNGQRLNKAYHFCKWLKCVNCRTVYFNDKFKTFPGTPCDCEKTDYVQTKLVPKYIDPEEREYLRPV